MTSLLLQSSVPSCCQSDPSGSCCSCEDWWHQKGWHWPQCVLGTVLRLPSGLCVRAQASGPSLGPAEQERGGCAGSVGCRLTMPGCGISGASGLVAVSSSKGIIVWVSLGKEIPALTFPSFYCLKSKRKVVSQRWV